MKREPPWARQEGAVQDGEGGKRRLGDALATVGILAGTVALTELLRQLRIENQSLILIYLLAVLAVSRLTSGYLYGIAAAVAGTLLFDWFLTEPRMDFSVSKGSPITLLIMLAVTFLTSTLTLQMKSQARLSGERERRARLMQEMNQKLLSARDIDAIAQVTAEYLNEHLRRAVVFHTQDPQAREAAAVVHAAGEEGERAAFFGEEEKKRVHRMFRGDGDPAAVFNDQSPAVHYQPVISQNTLLGLIGVYSGGEKLGKDCLSLVHRVADRAALALEIQYLYDRQSRTHVEAEKEKMRSTLLRSISHDLRTPLTSVLGASSAILEGKEMAPKEVEELARDIRDNTQWLIRMVENILTVTKLTGEAMQVHKSPEAMEEVVAQSVDIVRKRFPDWQIHVRSPEELLVAPMDATLIAQVVINLLENAVKNSTPGSLILVNLKREGGRARLDISDNGLGIPADVMDHLFQAHSPEWERSPREEPSVDASRGIGIGLSICQAIVHAHGGTIEGDNRKEGGARFTFFLPLEEKNGESKAGEALTE